MFKFFRRIRKQLISAGNLQKYLAYAAGGILLALQVNNWNIRRVDDINKKQLLARINNELQANIDRVNELTIYEQSRSFNDRQFNILEEGSLSDSLEVFFSRFPFPIVHPSLNFSAYKEAQSTGALYGLGSDSLVLKIENYYTFCERQTYSLVTANEKIGNETHVSAYNNAFREYNFKAKADFLSQNQWLADPTHPDYRATMILIHQVQVANSYFKRALESVAIESEQLKTVITKELTE